MGNPREDSKAAVTRILNAAADGDPAASEQLLPLMYEELQVLARQRMSAEGSDHTLQPTALVHEAYLRLVGSDAASWNSRGHFFAAAAEAMRRILIEHARRRIAEKHGGGRDVHQIDQEPEPAATEQESKNLLALHEALTRFEQVDSEKAALVKLRHFAGLTEEQAASALGISRATASRHWAFARAWLYDEITRLQRGED